MTCYSCKWCENEYYYEAFTYVVKCGKHRNPPYNNHSITYRFPKYSRIECTEFKRGLRFLEVLRRPSEGWIFYKLVT